MKLIILNPAREAFTVRKSANQQATNVDFTWSKELIVYLIETVQGTSYNAPDGTKSSEWYKVFIDDTVRFIATKWVIAEDMPMPSQPAEQRLIIDLPLPHLTFTLTVPAAEALLLMQQTITDAVRIALENPQYLPVPEETDGPS